MMHKPRRKHHRVWCKGGNRTMPDSFRPAKGSTWNPRIIRCAVCNRRLTPRTHIVGGGYEVISSVPPHKAKQ